MDALERIEIGLRVDITHGLGVLDPFAYMQPGLLHKDFCGRILASTGISRHQDWLTRHNQLISRPKRTSFSTARQVRTSATALDCCGGLGLWHDVHSVQRDARSRPRCNLGKVRHLKRANLASWLRSLNYLRNVCAHHSRLWNRNIIDQPKLPPVGEVPWVAPFVGNAHALARCYLLLCITRHLLRTVNPRSTWPQRDEAAPAAVPTVVPLGAQRCWYGGRTQAGTPPGENLRQ